MISEIVKNEIQIRIKSRTGIHCTNNAYVYLPHMCCESAAERVSQEEQLHCSKEMLVASHPSWLIATQQICDRCFQIYYCPCWFATMDVQELRRVHVAERQLSTAIESNIGRANCLRYSLVWQQFLRQRVLPDSDQVVHTYLQIVAIP